MDGAVGGQWLESIECQIIEGGTGDILMVAGAGKPAMKNVAMASSAASSPMMMVHAIDTIRFANSHRQLDRSPDRRADQHNSQARVRSDSACDSASASFRDSSPAAASDCHGASPCSI